jgi:hypothetical protein
MCGEHAPARPQGALLEARHEPYPLGDMLTRRNAADGRLRPGVVKNEFLEAP